MKEEHLGNDMVESWVEAHEQELLEQWENARNSQPLECIRFFWEKYSQKLKSPEKEAPA